MRATDADARVRAPAAPAVCADRGRRRAFSRAAWPALWLLLAAASACSVFVPRFQTPRLSVVGIQLGRSDLFQQHLRVRMHVENPNDRDLPVQGLDYQLMLAGEQVAAGESEASFVVPAHGSADFNMTATANLASALVRLFGHGSSGPIEYRLAGRVHLAAGLVRSIPFEEKGTFQLH
ncbi:MAG TPA: LEA type 2 family protein [Steroidobacteraceae bacterium]|nr:LEA type 2 family protein [Steroidobacteraceae bacterium]